MLLPFKGQEHPPKYNVSSISTSKISVVKRGSEMVKMMNGGEYSMPFFLPYRPQNTYSTIRVPIKKKGEKSW